MSKKNRYKFRDRPTPQPSQSPVSTASTPQTTNRDSSILAAHSEEYRIISNDMIRLVILNGIMLAAVLVVYFTNRSSGYLERLFERLF